jgi:hypothetical protein
MSVRFELREFKLNGNKTEQMKFHRRKRKERIL